LERASDAPILSLQKLDVRYGRAQVLFGVSLEVRRGEAVVLAGRNGAGKSTTLKTAMGLLQAASGSVVFDGQPANGMSPWDIARLGLGYVPEERRVFGELTVLENLEVGRLPPESGRRPWTFERAFALFPALAPLSARRAGTLSGGEQQMLTIARTLMGDPECLLLDEPSEGLAPLVVEQLAVTLGSLKADGLAMLLCEQNLKFAAQLADRAYIIEKGVIRHEGTVADLASGDTLGASYFAL
jgi:branched-chain amino acid transport system ATP-binding protein